MAMARAGARIVTDRKLGEAATVPDVPPDPAELRELAVAIAVEAAQLARDLRADGFTVETKSTDTDLVTNADRAVEQMIRDRLAAARPTDAILGEEQGEDQGEEHGDGDPAASSDGVRWVIDPIDGTTNFVYGHPGWAVSIAVEIDGRTVAGAVCDPSHMQTFAAAEGHGATCNGVGLQLDDPPPIGRVLLATGFGYAADRRAAQAGVMVGVLPTIRDIRRMGAASVDLCSVALGRVDAYYELGLSAWDLAAGSLVAAEAGARVGELHGGPLTPGGTILVCHPDLWDELADVLIASGA
jgi:myo-inositol-1(or 4)-monophosphatase